MKIKITITVLLLSFILASCTPAAKVLPTEAAVFKSIPSTICQEIVGHGLPSKTLAGTHVLFRGFERKEGGQIGNISIGDGKLLQLANYPLASQSLAFLPDGQRFLMIGYYDIWQGDLKGSAPIKIKSNDNVQINFQSYSKIWTEIEGIVNTNPPEDLNDYNIGRFHSPDNKKVISWKRGDRALVITDQITKQEFHIVPTGIQDTISGVWTTDSKWFIFTYTHGTPENYFSQLLMVSSDGTELRQLTKKFNKSSFEYPIISPDGKKVVFIKTEGVNQSIGIFWLDSYNLFVYQPDSYNRSWFLFGSSIVWSPDSQWFAIKIEKWAFREDVYFVNIESGTTYCAPFNLKDIEIDWR